MKGKEKSGKPLTPGKNDGDSDFLLNNHFKKNPFSVPAEYFNTLPEKIHAKINNNTQVAPVRPFPRIILISASAAAILIIIAFTIFLKSEYDLRGRQKMLSNQQNTQEQLANATQSVSGDPDSINKETPAADAPAEGIAPAGQTAKNAETHTRENQTKVIQSLEKEGISDEDIIQYLMDENFDPSETNN